MNGLGHDLGSAVLLKFPTPEEKTGIANNSQGRRTTADNLDARLNEILDPKLGDEMASGDPEGIDKLWYQSLFGLRDAAKKLYAVGIDVTQAPNPDDPSAMKAFTLFNKAMGVHFETRNKLRRAKELQDFMLNNNDRFDWNVPKDKLEDFQSILQGQNVRDANIKAYNSFASSASAKPLGPEDQAQLENFYKETVVAIQKYHAGKGSPPEVIEADIAKLIPPRKLDEAARTAELGKTEAETGAIDAMQRYRDAAAANQYASSKLNTQKLETEKARAAKLIADANKVRTGGGKESIPIGLLDLYKIAVAIKDAEENPALAMSQLAGSEDTKLFAGRKYNDGMFKSFSYSPSLGVGHLVFEEPRKPVLNSRGTQQTVKGEAKWTPAKTYSIDFRGDDISSVLSMLTASDQTKVREDVFRRELFDEKGRIVPEKIIEFVNGLENGTEQDDTDEVDIGLPGTEDESGIDIGL